MRISDWSSDVCSSDLGEILAVDLQQVENKIGEALAARFQRCLQSGKIGLSLRTQPDNFAIKQRRIHINVRSGSNDFGKFLRPVEPRARIGTNLIGALSQQATIAVIFQFVEPLVSSGDMIDKRGKLRLDRKS